MQNKLLIQSVWFKKKDGIFSVMEFLFLAQKVWLPYSLICSLSFKILVSQLNTVSFKTWTIVFMILKNGKISCWALQRCQSCQINPRIDCLNLKGGSKIGKGLWAATQFDPHKNALISRPSQFFQIFLFWFYFLKTYKSKFFYHKNHI